MAKVQNDAWQKAFDKANPFDAYNREILGKNLTPESFKKASVNVCDTLHIAAKIAQQELKENFTGTDVVAICKMIMEENSRLEASEKTGL